MSKVNIESEVTGKVWKIISSAGMRVDENDPILIIESMKMEIAVDAPKSGTVVEILVKEGDDVHEGQVVASLADSS